MPVESVDRSTGLTLNIIPRAQRMTPLQAGTPIYKVDKNGSKISGPQYSVSWNSRVRPQPLNTGCSQWICYIAVGDTPAEAQAGRDSGLILDTGIASSSRSSMHVRALHTDERGKVVKHEDIHHVVGAQVRNVPGLQFPEALEIWFCNELIDPNTILPDGSTLAQVEQDCQAPHLHEENQRR